MAHKIRLDVLCGCRAPCFGVSGVLGRLGKYTRTVIIRTSRCVITSRIPIVNLVTWVRPPPTHSGILGTYKGPNIITVILRGHY